MKINCSYSELHDVDTLQPHPRNTNNHPEKQIRYLAKIIDYTGQRAPIVVSKRSGFITKGHLRLAAVKELGWEKVAIDIQDYESEAQEYADLEADNNIARMAEHDAAKTAENIRDLALEDFDFELMGLEEFKVDVLDDAPDIPDIEEAGTRQYAFIVTHEQAETIDRAVSAAKSLGEFADTGNSNSNGNALERICETFITVSGDENA